MGYLTSSDYVTSDLMRIRTLFANLYLFQNEDSVVLIDAGLPGYAASIMDIMGKINKPLAAIILTHGHFDHVGALKALMKEYPDTPVYAHAAEFPFLSGRKEYPEPDTRTGKGFMASISFLYPRGPIDIRPALKMLPADESVPHMKGWRWVHTPGHTPGHISLFRGCDHCLIAGDAFVTVRQESLFHVARQDLQINGPPAYFTTDWTAAHKSLQVLYDLSPSIAATGHGKPMRGQILTASLTKLLLSFEHTAVPKRGRYRNSYRTPAIDTNRIELSKEEGSWQKLIRRRQAVNGNRNYIPDPAAAPLGTDQEAGGPISTPQGNRRDLWN